MGVKETGLLLIQNTAVEGIIRSRGRPKKNPNTTPPIKQIDKILEAINNYPGQPILYASTTKGTMKLVHDGHHFRYIFRKGSYSIFQCCYKENKEECNVRIVTDQKMVYPLDGEHIHFVQANDKSATSIQFTPGESPETAEKQDDVDEQQMVFIDEATPVFLEENLPQPMDLNIKKEPDLNDEAKVLTSSPSPDQNSETADEFREKIKKRLQRALLGKKKP